MTEKSRKKRISVNQFFYRLGPHRIDLIDFKKIGHKKIILEGLKLILEKTSVYFSVSEEDEESQNLNFGDLYVNRPKVLSKFKDSDSQFF